MPYSCRSAPIRITHHVLHFTFYASFVLQRIDRVEPRCTPSWPDPKERPDRQREAPVRDNETQQGIKGTSEEMNHGFPQVRGGLWAIGWS
jgi:hypothetical protein